MNFKLLDCFCGMGGASQGFFLEGFDVTGIDIVDAPKMLGYKHCFIQADMLSLKGEDFRGYDVIWGSPPCRDFSQIGKMYGKKWKEPPNPEKGLELIRHFLQFTEDAQPKIWILENVALLKKYFKDLEPKIENTAMMQVSMFHKSKGDTVELYSPLFHKEYDRIYCFSIFQFTSKQTVTKDMICGGTGFNIASRLPPEIEVCDLDYSIFPKCKTSYLWFSRGCFRNCPFCVVPAKEGKLHSVEPKNLNPNGKYISVMDNSPTANPKFYEVVDWLVKIGQPIDFQCGIDARIFNAKQGKALQRLKFWKQLRTAWDNPRENVAPKLEEITHFISKGKIMVYVLIGYWSTMQEDLDRVLKIRELGLDAWIMPYNKNDPYQKAFNRWNNGHANCIWEDYECGAWK